MTLFDPASMFRDEVRDVYLDERQMKDELAVEIVGLAAEDPDTGVPIGQPQVRTYIVQPCADEDLRIRMRAPAIINGVPGNMPVSLCYTRYFPWPEVAEGEAIVVRVNGRWRPLMKSGPPTDVGGQKSVYQLELGPPEEGR